MKVSCANISFKGGRILNPEVLDNIPKASKTEFSECVEYLKDAFPDNVDLWLAHTDCDKEFKLIPVESNYGRPVQIKKGRAMRISLRPSLIPQFMKDFVTFLNNNKHILR